MSSTCNPRQFAFEHDRDGRVTQVAAAAGSIGSSRWSLTFDYGGAQGGNEAVFKAVSGGAQWLTYTNYFYDAFGRRRLKQDPVGAEQEFFYGLGNQLLADVQKPGSGSYPTTPIIDQYVWLGGRPVAIIRNRLDSNFNYQFDQSGDCRRVFAEGDTTCGTYFPVTDHIGKPVLMLDAEGRIAGAADYDPFGRANHVTFTGTQPPTYANNLSNHLQWDMHQPPEPGMSLKMRLLFQLNDGAQGSGDYAEVKDIDNGQVLASTSMWMFSTPWLSTQAGHIGLFMNSDSANCCPTQGGFPDCGCAQAPDYPFKGVVPEAYEYQRFQAGATPFWTPLGFPGQYHDWDTGLEENWNRYYFAAHGDYLQPEPLLRSPNAYVAYTRRGHSLPAYAYALNNPLRWVDLDGYSPQERSAILNQFDAAVNRMTWDANRLNAPILNNIAEMFWRGNELKACEAQASYTKSWLHSNVKLSDYELEYAGGRTGPFGLFPHQWVVATSKVDNSVIVLDPWANEAWETTWFPGSSQFEWSNYPLRGDGSDRDVDQRPRNGWSMMRYVLRPIVVFGAVGAVAMMVLWAAPFSTVGAASATALAAGAALAAALLVARIVVVVAFRREFERSGPEPRIARTARTALAGYGCWLLALVFNQAAEVVVFNHPLASSIIQATTAVGAVVLAGEAAALLATRLRGASK